MSVAQDEEWLARIRSCWCAVLGIPSVGDEDDFFALGGDSLSATSMAIEVERCTGLPVPLGMLYAHPRLSAFVRELVRQDAGELMPYLVPLRPSGRRIPLFAIAPAMGGVFHFRQLGPELPDDQPFYCLEPRISGEGAHAYESIEHLASLNLKLIRSIQPQGPYRLIGYSFGGTIAWEMARQLEAVREQVDVLVVCDSAGPIHGSAVMPGRFRITRRVRLLAERLHDHHRHRARLHPSHLLAHASQKTRDTLRALRRQSSATASPSAQSLAGLTGREALEVPAQKQMRERYDYGRYGGDLVLLRAKRQLTLRREIDYELGWGRILSPGRLHIIPVEGSHFTLLRQPRVGAVARELMRVIHGADRHRAAVREEEIRRSAGVIGRVPFPEPVEGLAVTRRFARLAAAQGDCTAIRDGGTTLSYTELDDLSSRLARNLVARYGPDSEPVLLCFQSGWAFAVALLAVLKAGKFYVPVDSEFPPERVRRIALASETRLVIAPDELMDTAREAIDNLPVTLEPLFGLLSGESAVQLPDPDAFSPAALLFTSGSTGTPKGVAVTHAQITHLVWRRSVSASFTSRDRYLMVYTPAFMGGLMAIFGALLCGANLCFYNLRRRGVRQLAQWVAEEKITILHAVTSIYRRFVASLDGSEDLSSIRHIIPGGEPSRHSDVEMFKKFFAPGTIYYGCLGSTECGTIAFNPITHDTVLEPGPLPVGIPHASLNVHLLDDAGNVVPEGAEGEITLHSRFIFRGYWKNPAADTGIIARTPDGFVTYRTGDFGRFNSRGQLINLGRRDSQIKINGYRVDLAEVESALLAVPGIREASVVLRYRQPDNRDPVLAAFYVAADASGQSPSPESLRASLQERLPVAMIPGLFLPVSRFPATPNGKTDRNRLRNAPFEEMDFLLPISS